MNIEFNSLSTHSHISEEQYCLQALKLLHTVEQSDIFSTVSKPLKD